MNVTFFVAILVYGISLFAAGLLLRHVGPRPVGVAGGILFGVGVFLSSFAGGSLPLLYVTYGLVAAVGSGLGYIVRVAVLPKWFPGRAGLAYGLAVVGLGPVVNVPLISALISADVVLHLNYTAREGGEVLRAVANDLAQRHLPGSGVRFFDFRHELPDAWHRFHQPHPDGQSKRQLGVRLSRDMFPFSPGRSIVRIERLDLFFQAPGAEPSTHHEVEFLIPYLDRYGEGDETEVKRHTVTCVASAEWPDLFHGVLDLQQDPIAIHDERHIGTFHFPKHTGAVSHASLFCGYTSERAQAHQRPRWFGEEERPERPRGVGVSLMLEGELERPRRS